MWITNSLWVGAVILVALLCLRVGYRRGRSEAVTMFQGILLEIYKLVWSGRQDELRRFLHEICTDDPLPMPTKDRPSKGQQGYIE